MQLSILVLRNVLRVLLIEILLPRSHRRHNAARRLTHLASEKVDSAAPERRRSACPPEIPAVVMRGKPPSDGQEVLYGRSA